MIFYPDNKTCDFEVEDDDGNSKREREESW